MREIRSEASVFPDELVERLRLFDRKVVRSSAAGTHEMHMFGFVGEVVFGSSLEVSVRKNSDALEHRDGAVHGRSVDAGHPLLDFARDGGRAYVALSPRDFGDDGPPLRRHPETFVLQDLHHVDGPAHAPDSSSSLQVQGWANSANRPNL